MLFYLVAASPAPLPPAKCWWCPWHVESHQILRECCYAADLCKIAAHCGKKSKQMRHIIPKCTPELTFGRPEGHFLLKILESGLLQKAWYTHGFRDILDFVVAPCANCMRKKCIFALCSQFVSAWVVPGSEKYIHWGTKGSPKTPKAAQSDSPGHQKCNRKATLGLYRVPRAPIRSQEHPQDRKKHQNDTKIEI